MGGDVLTDGGGRTHPRHASRRPGARPGTHSGTRFREPGALGDESELLLGEWLAAHGAADEVAVATKIGARPRAGSTGFGAIEGLNAAAVAAQVDGSMQRLGVDRIDLLYAHIDDRAVPLAETLGAFDALVRSGRVETVACSNTGTQRLQAALATSDREGVVRYAADQLRASYLRPRTDADFGVQVPLTDDLAALCNDAGVVVLGYSGLLGGAYTRADRPVPAEYRHEHTEAGLAAVRTVAGRHAVTPNQVVLGWLRQTGVVPVLGVSTVSQLAQATAAAGLDLTAGDLAELAAARG